MRPKLLFPAFLFLSFTILTSCIKEEGLNLEADVIRANVTDPSILSEEPIITNNSITFQLKENYSGDFTFSPEFVLSSGATIEPQSGTALDFSQSHQYTVTSENGDWTKKYTVAFRIAGQDTLMSFSFEKADTINTASPEGHYVEFYHLNPDKPTDTVKIWNSGNQGYNILAATLVPEGQQLTPSFYPTSQTTEGYNGNGILLQTKETGPLGTTFGSPLAAGSLFIGTFKLAFPTVNSPRFGMPYNQTVAPKALKGYFKYKAGKDFVVNNAPSDLTEDTWDAYAVLFEKKEGKDNYLPPSNVFDNPRVVSIARLNDNQRIETNQWTKFYIPFKNKEGKSFDPNKDYLYTIVFTSSKEGNSFNGAVGSKLWIDEVQLVTTK